MPHNVFVVRLICIMWLTTYLPIGEFEGGRKEQKRSMLGEILLIFFCDVRSLVSQDHMKGFKIWIARAKTNLIAWRYNSTALVPCYWIYV